MKDQENHGIKLLYLLLVKGRIGISADMLVTEVLHWNSLALSTTKG